MLHTDAIDLYDLAESGRFLFCGPRTLERGILRRSIPACRIQGQWALPRAWVDAECGRTPVDADALRSYWLGRLSPPSPDARRARRDLAALAGREFSTATEAAAALLCTPGALRRLDQEGVLPSLRICGQPQYDTQLLGLLQREEAGEDVGEALARCRDELARLSGFEYSSEDASPERRPQATAATGPVPETTASAPETTGSAAETRAQVPGAYEPASDLFESPPPPARLLRVEGFETVDED